MSEIVNFRIEPVTVEIGEKKKALIVRDLSFDNQQKLLRKIGALMFEKQATEIGVRNLDKAITAEMMKQGKSADEVIKNFVEKVADIYTVLNGDITRELLKIATNDAITDEDLSTMGAGEQANLLIWLLDRQFKSLKNLHASLNSILSPTKTESPKSN